MSSTITTGLPFIFSCRPINSVTLPVEVVESYEDILINEISIYEIFKSLSVPFEISISFTIKLDEI
jgi:hypothetical protein